MSFHVSISFPFDHIQHPEEFVTQQAVIDCAKTAEEAGFTAASVTDHPDPVLPLAR